MAQLEMAFGGLFLWLLLIIFVISSRGFDFRVDVKLKNCCYGDYDVKHGHVATVLPSCCLLQVCQNGQIQDWPVGRPGEKHCCEFDGRLYPDGSVLTTHCLALKCKVGRWITPIAIEQCCEHCYLYNDPHIFTFDDYSYDFHGTCNHTVTQIGFSSQPAVGVFSDFKQCNGDASCLSHTTFRDNPHTIIELDNQNVYNLVVNGDQFTVPPGGVHPVRSSSGHHPVLAWKEDNCIFLLGSSKLMLQHCQHRLDVWAHPVHTGLLHGLCGHFNSYKDDDFTDSLGGLHALHPRPRVFPESWRTSDQKDRLCNAPCPRCYDETTDDQCRATRREREEYKHRCVYLLNPIIGRDAQLRSHIDNCAFDLCMMRQNGASDELVDRWLREVQIILQQNKIILARTLDGEHPEIQELPDNIRCTLGSSWKIECNQCKCSKDGTSIICTLISCPPDYVHEFGEDACEDGSRWQSGCNFCVCVRGGTICSLEICDSNKPKRCLLNVDAGPCEALIKRYAYNKVTDRCKEFYYGGCLGNENNFETEQECWETCHDYVVGGGSRPEECLLPKDPGPCYGAFPRYAFNSETGKCEPFIYGGCQGNSNNFHSLQECKIYCKALDGIVCAEPLCATGCHTIIDVHSGCPICSCS